MATSGSLNSKNEINDTDIPAITKYPASVIQVSKMLDHAHKESLPLSTAGTARVSAPSRISVGTRFFKYSHTCGSLYAKCGCKDDSNESLETFDPVRFSRDKRVSSLDIEDSHKYDIKRFSSPEINTTKVPAQVCQNCKLQKCSQKDTYKANVYLNHPEINFPIPIVLTKEDSDKLVPKLSKSLPSNLVPALKNNLDYHNLTALGYESHQLNQKEEEAQKFLQDFGIITPMGNGASVKKSSRSSIDEDVIQQIRKTSKSRDSKLIRSVSQQEYEHLKVVNERLMKDLADLELKHENVMKELYETKQELNSKNRTILKQHREIHKLKSVLQQTASPHGDLLSNIQKQHAMANMSPQNQQSLNNTNLLKKQGVSAESSEAKSEASHIDIPKFEKDFRSKQLIKDAIMDNDFLKHLDTSQVREMIDSMNSKEFQAGTFVVEEGKAGIHLFVSAEGEFEVIKDGKILGRMGPGKAFGELAILYNCTRTASIRAVTNGKVWMLDRKVFQQIMMRTGLQRLEDNINFLKSVPLLQNLNADVLSKIADALEVEFYPADAYIIRQGASGDTFFIISSGSVKVTQRLPDRLEEEEIRILKRGDYFGEQALLKEDVRTASVIALHPGVECLTLDRDSFNQLIGDMSEIKEKSYGDEERQGKPLSTSNQEPQEYEYITINDLEVIGTLGIGGFGRVELVQYVKNPSLTFALKCLKKYHIVNTQQQDHVMSERNILLSCQSPFITRMYKTFREPKYVYMLLEACLGGEVWTILRDRGCFDDHTTRFITACVVEAFDYLHGRGIIYRDLKPENLLLDSKGYVKLVDFGFSKRLGSSNKTWTFCGTPEYVAPETILNKGHDRAVDYWALGILMHELLTGNPPFTASDPMKTYHLILKGIDMIDFERYNIRRTAQSLIKKLCRDSPSERLGYQRGGIQDIKKHKWFQSFDWDGLIARTLPAPIQQPVRGPTDISNFDCFAKDNDVPPDELSGWDACF